MAGPRLCVKQTMMRRLLNALRGLRAKLIYTYILVTTGALLLLELLMFMVFVLFSWVFGSPVTGYLNDVHYVLSSRATPYFEMDPPDINGLQQWLLRQYQSGYASLPPQYFMDNPAAALSPHEPMLIVAPDGKILAAAPESAAHLVGTQYEPTNPIQQHLWDFMMGRDMENPSYGYSWEYLFGNYDIRYGSTYATDDDHDSYLVAVPLFTYDSIETDTAVVVEEEVLEDALVDDQLEVATPLPQEIEQLQGIILARVEPPPSIVWQSLEPVLLALMGTGLLLLVAVTPFGALFGFIMSGHLTRRLANLAAAADAWSQGNFNVVPKDRSADEIGRLGMRMRHMAEQIQTLLETRQELAALEERNRLARELHDTVKQQSFATLMHLRAAQNLLGNDKDNALTHLQEAENLVKLSQQELALLIAELRPAALEGQGLAAAVSQYADVWSKQASIQTAVHVRGERSLPLAAEQALYRVLQEGLANVARHSGAKQVDIDLAYQKEWVTLSIKDNGHGFVLGKSGQEGFGLQSMRQRMVALGGTFVVDSQLGQGTLLKAAVPLPAK